MHCLSAESGMAARVEKESDSLSQKRLIEHDSEVAFHFPVSSPAAARVPAATGGTYMLAVELSREMWLPGPAKIGRPRIDSSCVRLVNLFMLVAEAAARTKSFTALETLIADGFPVGRPVDVAAVRGYRLWVAMDELAMTASGAFVAELLSGAVSGTAKRSHTGETKTYVPGDYEVTYSAFHSTARLINAIRSYTSGQYRGHDELGFTFDTAPGVATDGATAGGDGEHSNDTFFSIMPDPDTAAPPPGAMTEPRLPATHPFAVFEAAMLFSTAATANRHTTGWNLRSDQRNIASYLQLEGQLRFPAPTLVTVVPWGDYVFESSQSLHVRVLPDHFPDRDVLATAIRESIARTGGDVRGTVDRMSMEELIALIEGEGTEDAAMADPSMFAPIKVPPHAYNPGIASATSQGAKALRETYPVIERTKHHTARVLDHARTGGAPPYPEVRRKLDTLFAGTPDGVPPAYHAMRIEAKSIEHAIKSRRQLGSALAREWLYSKKLMKGVRRAAAAPMAFDSVTFIQMATLATDKLGLTQGQLCPFMMMWTGLARLCWHTAHTSFFVTMEGKVAKGKTEVLKAIITTVPAALVTEEGTMSRLADCRHKANNVSVQDDVKWGDDNGGFQSRASTGVRTHSRLTQDQMTGEWTSVTQTWVAESAVLCSTNHPLPTAVGSRAIRTIMLDQLDGDGKSIMDEIATPKNPSYQASAALCFKRIACDTARFWELQLAGLVQVCDLLFYAVIAIARAVQGDSFVLEERIVEHIKYCAIANMAWRLACNWERVLRPAFAAAGEDSATLEDLRDEYYTYASIVTATDVLRAGAMIAAVADKSAYRAEVVGAIRDAVIFAGGHPVESECKLYFETDLPVDDKSLSQRIAGTVSFNAPGVTYMFIRELQALTDSGKTVLKVGQPPGGQKRLFLLKTHALSPLVVTSRDRLVINALLDLYETEPTTWAVEFDEPDDPYIGYRSDVLRHFTSPNETFNFHVSDGVRGQLGLGPTLAMMTQGRDDFDTTNEMGHPLEMNVANVFDPNDPSVPLVPPGSVPVRPGGVLDAAGQNLVKCSKVWQGGVRIKLSTLNNYAMRRAASGTAAPNPFVTHGVFSAALAAEGSAVNGESVAIGAYQRRTATGASVATDTYTAVDSGWSVRVRNHITRCVDDDVAAGQSGEDLDDELSDSEAEDMAAIDAAAGMPDVADDAQPHDPARSGAGRARGAEQIVFGSAVAAWTTFTASSRLYRRLEDYWGASIAGPAIRPEFRRSSVDYRYSTRTSRQ